MATTTTTRDESTNSIWRECNGKKSWIRAMCFLCLLASFAFAWLTITLGSSEGIYITFAFLLAAFTPKTVQKFIEQKLDNEAIAQVGFPTIDTTQK
jgi:hypothetical protein